MVKVRGGELKQPLQKVEARLRQELLTALAETAGAIEQGAKSRSPVRTGKLRSGIKATIEPLVLKAKVKPNVPYDVHVEFGTSKQKAQPYMRPTAEAERDAFVKRAIEAVQKVTR